MMNGRDPSSGGPVTRAPSRSVTSPSTAIGWGEIGVVVADVVTSL